MPHPFREEFLEIGQLLVLQLFYGHLNSKNETSICSFLIFKKVFNGFGNIPPQNRDIKVDKVRQVCLI